MITFKHRGNLSKTSSFLAKMARVDYRTKLEKYGKMGVEALASATPVDTGKTASSWEYEIAETNTGYRIYWKNKNVVDGVCIAVILQFGHGTRNGGYVVGRDYINPAMKKTFDGIADSAWKEVTSS